MRSQTDGSGLVTLVDEQSFSPFESIFLSGSTVLYHTTAPPLPPTQFGLTDIWQVQTDGTGRRVVAEGPDAETVRAVIGSSILYDIEGYTNGTVDNSKQSWRRAQTDRPGSNLVTDTLGIYQVHVGERAVFDRVTSAALFSVNLDGTDERQVLDAPPARTTLGVGPTVGSSVLLTLFQGRPLERVALQSVPVTGGPVVTLTDSPDYTSLGAVVGNRVVYHRCAIIGVDEEFGDPVAGPCDLYSVLSDGTGTVALATTPDNEVVQGIIGERVIVRRNSASSDSLFSIPVSGGAETPLRSLSASGEFVSAIVGDRVILKRPSGLWSLKVDGSSLVQLTSDGSDWFGGSTEPFVCFTRGEALWCVPTDGSGLATLVTTSGTYVIGL